MASFLVINPTIGQENTQDPMIRALLSMKQPYGRRERIWTADPFRVKEVLSPWATRLKNKDLD